MRALKKKYSTIILSIMFLYLSANGSNGNEKIEFILNLVQQNIILFKVYAHSESIKRMTDSTGEIKRNYYFDYLFKLTVTRGCVLDLAIVKSDWTIPNAEMEIYEIKKYGDVDKCGDSFLVKSGEYPYSDDTKFLIGYDSLKKSIIFISGMFFTNSIYEYFKRYYDDVEKIKHYLNLKLYYLNKLDKINLIRKTNEFMDFEILYQNKGKNRLRLFKSEFRIQWLD